jgi:hypothetical protein
VQPKHDRAYIGKLLPRFLRYLVFRSHLLNVAQLRDLEPAYETLRLERALMPPRGRTSPLSKRQYRSINARNEA